MKKIISLFQRNYDGDRLVRNEVTPGAEWVTNGEGIATRKTDGTCCMIKDGKIYKRYDAKNGKQPPAGFIPAQDPDLITGHWPGWLKCQESNPNDKWHFNALTVTKLPDGTYELLGPNIQGNPEKLPNNILVKHGDHVLTDCPRDFDSLKEYLKPLDIEGIVWHHPDGRMVKIKKKDFGFKR